MIEASYGPLKGMPERLPDGEVLVWQGRPHWWALARRALHLPAIAAYFGVLLIWPLAAGLTNGFAATGSWRGAVWLLGLALVVLGIVTMLAWLYSRTTVYSMTNRRVVMHIGLALPMALNVPYSQIGAASARIHGDGTADIPLTLLGNDRIAYLHLWPHVRPWRLQHPEPMLRGVPEGARVAELLAKQLKAAQPDHATAAASEEKSQERMPGPLAPAAA